MIAFVAGATGYTGAELVRALAGRGIDTVAHVRPDSARLAEWTRRFGALGAAVDTTPWNDEALRATLARIAPDLVFALLGTTRARAREAGRRGRDEGYDAVDYGLTMMLARATRDAVPRARFVYLSSIGVSEQTRNPYLRARAQVEAGLRALGIEHVIVRPSFITGPDRAESRPLERSAARAVDAALTVAAALGAKRLRARYRSRTAAALADALVRVATDDRANRVVESEELD
jgi:uncharacterized protein YbjT (DUF2867 family)